MKETAARIIVVGGLNTDIVATGVDDLLGRGELSRSGELFIGPGGKSSNIARMSACLLGPERVFMVGKTSRDPYGLWEVPVKALREAGVNTDQVQETDETGCGDQATAVVCAETLRGKTINEAARLAVHAGTLQFHRRGIHPVYAEELEEIDD